MVEYGRTLQVAYEAWRDDNVPGTLDLLTAPGPTFAGGSGGTFIASATRNCGRSGATPGQ